MYFESRYFYVIHIVFFVDFVLIFSLEFRLVFIVNLTFPSVTKNIYNICIFISLLSINPRSFPYVILAKVPGVARGILKTLKKFPKEFL